MGGSGTGIRRRRKAEALASFALDDDEEREIDPDAWQNRCIQRCMKRALLCRPTCCTLTFALLTAVGCSPAERSPDAIRQDTAKATSEATRDAKAVVQGVVEGLKTKGPVNINKADADQIATLPGITAGQARRIVAARPYDNSDELVKRHLVSRDEYNRIADKVVTK